MIKLFVFAIPIYFLGFFSGIAFKAWWNRFLLLKEQRIKLRLERQELERLPTEVITAELFEREDAWQAISEQADKESLRR